ncbi:MAG: hypothetical protein ACR2G2_06485 [Pseudonocardia sp.]
MTGLHTLLAEEPSRASDRQLVVHQVRSADDPLLTNALRERDAVFIVMESASTY